MKKWFVLIFAFLPGLMYAHGGHGPFDPHTLIHYLGTPEHAIPIFTAVAVIAWVWHRKRKAAGEKG